VYVVLAYDCYYPGGDNIRGIFTDINKAKILAISLQLGSDWDIVEVEEKEAYLDD